MDPKSGRVYTVVSQAWALRRGFKPCSTIKLVTGLAGVTEKVVDPLQTISVSDRRYAIDLTDSLAIQTMDTSRRLAGASASTAFQLRARLAGRAHSINHANESPGRLAAFEDRLCRHGCVLTETISRSRRFNSQPSFRPSATAAIFSSRTCRARRRRCPLQKPRAADQIPQESLRHNRSRHDRSGQLRLRQARFDPLQTIAGKPNGIGQALVSASLLYAPVKIRASPSSS